MYVIIKGDERRAAEARALRDFGIAPARATAELREFAEHIAAAERLMANDFKRMEEKSS